MSPRYRLPILIARYDQLIRFSEAKRTRCGRSRVDTGPDRGRVRSRAEGAHGAEGKDRCPHSSCGVVAQTGGRRSCGPASPAAGGGGSVRTAAQDRHLQGGQLHQPQHAWRSHGRAGRDRFHPWTAALTQALASVAISALGTFAFNLPFSVPAPMLLESAASTVFASMAVAASVAWRDASQPIGGASLRVAEQHEADRRIGG